MRGRQAGEQLEKVRAVVCARNGLNLVSGGHIPDNEVERLYSIYSSSPQEFISTMTNRMTSLIEDIRTNENPADAVELAMVAGLLVDRMTNRQLMESEAFTTTRNGLAAYSGFGYNHQECADVTPYHGKDVSA